MKWCDKSRQIVPGERSATRVDIDLSLVRALILAQFPHWANLPIEPVARGGWDHTTFRLGEEMTVRLPSADRYSAQVEKEHRWLPKFGPLLTLPIPVPLAMGAPGHGYPWNWSIYGWLEGEDATIAPIANLRHCAITLAEFLLALQRIDPAGGPPPGPHNFYRGGSLEIYDAQTRQAIRYLAGTIDQDAVASVWDAALKAEWRGRHVWLHGDVSAGNLLITSGDLSAVIDFGSMGVGDPACDLVIAWTLFSGESRDVFRTALPVDPGTWSRAMGWALWKALITLAEDRDSISSKAGKAQRVLNQLVAEHQHA